jgi:hypothetical protein
VARHEGTIGRLLGTLNSALRPGTTSTVQPSGASGVTVQYTRQVFKGETLVRNERFTVRYDAQNAIVEVGPKAAPKRPVAPKAGPKPPAQTGQDEAPTSTTG